MRSKEVAAMSRATVFEVLDELSGLVAGLFESCAAAQVTALTGTIVELPISQEKRAQIKATLADAMLVMPEGCLRIAAEEAGLLVVAADGPRLHAGIGPGRYRMVKQDELARF